MLHEVLLALSGHPSPLFAEPSQDPHGETFPDLTTSERALLRSIGNLSDLHRKLRQLLATIAAQHPSTICQAVAISIQQSHLARFQTKILDVESRILTSHASLVGAYDIVPLASVVTEFDDWHRLMAWYWTMACFMQDPLGEKPNPSETHRCSGAHIIDKLRMEQRTGFPEVESAATELSKTAESAWLRQLAPWLLYGTLPSHGAADFFIQPIVADRAQQARFQRRRERLPEFVSDTTAASILFIGKSLDQARLYGRQVESTTTVGVATLTRSELVSEHLKLLSAVSLPIVPAHLSRTVSRIRQSLSRNLLQQLLPMDMTLELLACLRQFFLLGRTSFAPNLIRDAESRMHARQQSVGKLSRSDPSKALQNLTVNDAEVHEILLHTFKTLASDNDDEEDKVLDFARRNLTLAKPVLPDARPPSPNGINEASDVLNSSTFDDLLFPTAATLQLNIPRPLDLVISPGEAQTYSSIHAYLTAIQRAHLRLSDLWRRTEARRDHSVSATSTPAMKAISSRRQIGLRQVWATCRTAVLLLSETTAYIEGELINGSWDHFERWVKEAQPSELRESSDDIPSPPTQRDPETLASGHHTFLSSLTHAMLLTDAPWTRLLRSLFSNIDTLIALFTLLLDVHQKLDLEHTSGGETGHTSSEEQRISLELDRARRKVDSGLQAVVSRLRQLDQERIGSGKYLSITPSDSGFVPWQGGGVESLLMKLDFVRFTTDEP